MRKKDLRQIGPPRPGERIPLKIGACISEQLYYSFMKKRQNRADTPQPGLLAPEVT